MTATLRCPHTGHVVYNAVTKTHSATVTGRILNLQNVSSITTTDISVINSSYKHKSPEQNVSDSTNLVPHYH